MHVHTSPSWRRRWLLAITSCAMLSVTLAGLVAATPASAAGSCTGDITATAPDGGSAAETGATVKRCAPNGDVLWTRTGPGASETCYHMAEPISMVFDGAGRLWVLGDSGDYCGGLVQGWSVNGAQIEGQALSTSVDEHAWTQLPGNRVQLTVDGVYAEHPQHVVQIFPDGDPAPEVPGRPAKPTVTAGTDQAVLSWSTPADGGSPITGYRITPFRAGVAQPPIDVGLVTSKTVTDLSGATSYTFTVAARNAKGLGTASPPSTAVVTKRSSTESFVMAGFQDYIGRAPTPAELSYGLALVGNASSIQKRSQFTIALSQSDTYLGAVVNKLYVDTLGRPGDTGGIAYWTDQLRTGKVTVAQTAGLFYASDEYYNGFGGGDLSTWITDLYDKVLLREPDEGGLAYYIDLAEQTNRYTVAFPFYQSVESSETRTNALYRHFLGRAADQGGLDYWSTRIPALGDVALASNLTLSIEYLDRAATRYP